MNDNENIPKSDIQHNSSAMDALMSTSIDSSMESKYDRTNISSDNDDVDEIGEKNIKHVNDDGQEEEENTALCDIHESENENNLYQLEPGDHIYSWRALGAYSHHGIVLSVTKVSVVILDFYPTKPYSNDDGSMNNHNHCPPLRILNVSEWKRLYGTPRKVLYNAPYLKRTFYRSGTCCSMESHPSFLVIARARFLLLSSDFETNHHSLPTNEIDDDTETNQSLNEQKCYIPEYHTLHANSETLSVWCKTGHYSTLQVADFLHMTWAGQLKSSITLSAYLSTQTVQIPAAGLWGYMGFTTKVGLLSTQPLLLPALIGYGVLTVGTPLYMLRKCHDVWNRIEQDLNDLFWRGGLNSGDVSLNDLVLDFLDYYFQSE